MYRPFNIAIAACVCLVLAASAPAQSGWIPQSSGVHADLYSVDFLDAQTGWVAGASGTILHTSNGGAEWTPQVSNTGYTLLSVDFLNPSFGLAVGMGGTILRTTDGGANWVVIRTDWMDTLFEVFILDEQRAWVVGQNAIFAPYVGRTTNGGLNWTFSTFYIQNNEATLSDVHFVSPTVGFASAMIWDGRGAVCRTTDGGASWTVQTVIANALSAIDMSSPLVGTAGGRNGTLVRTTDGGDTWNWQSNGNGGWVYGVALPTDAVGFCVGDAGSIARTEDGGANWAQQSSGTGYALLAVDFVNTVVGTAVGEGGTILHTVTGGMSGADVAWEPLIPPVGRLTSAPNPFQRTTDIGYELAASGHVLIEIFDSSGRRVRSVVAGQRDAGRHTWVWDGTDDFGRQVARGAYIARARVAGAAHPGGGVAARTLIFLGTG